MKAGGRIIITSSGVGVMGFLDISPYASSKGAIESFTKCMNIEYKEKGISFHIFHPPLCNTKSAYGLPIPDEFKVKPEKVLNNYWYWKNGDAYISAGAVTSNIVYMLSYLELQMKEKGYLKR